MKKMGLFAVSGLAVYSIQHALMYRQTVFARQDGTESYYFNSQLFNKLM